MKKMFIIFVLVLSILTFSNNFSYSVGIEISGALFPYFNVYYNMDNIQFGGSFGFVFGPDEKNPGQWNFLFSPAINIGYFITENLSIESNVKMIVVYPYHYEQLYLSGVGIKYGFPLNNDKINLSLSGNFVIPISAGEKTWENNKFYPIPFIKGEYEF